MLTPYDQYMLATLTGVERQQYKAAIFGKAYGSKSSAITLDIMRSCHKHKLQERPLTPSEAFNKNYKLLLL